MKIRVYKHAMERWVPLEEIDMFQAAGWSQHKPADKTVTLLDTVVLKAPAKSKGAAKSLDNAIDKGD
jgi:hypothetical protein